MKLEPRRVEAFLRDPGKIRVVLLHGEDVGLVRERAGMLVRQVAGSLDDPFRVVELERDEVGRIPEEMRSQSLTGGRRVVRVRDATDAAASPVQAALAGPGEALVVLEAPGLAARSKLRGLVEKAADAAALACYAVEGRALEAVIREGLAELEVTVDPDALSWLASQLGADQGMTRREIDKLATYAGRGGRVDGEAARACVGDLAGLSVDDALFAATAGDVAGADRALELAMAEGAAAVAVLRAALMHMQRLQRARVEVDGGASVGEAAKSVRPPVFFRRESAFSAALGAWSGAALQAGCLRLWEAERSCKRTGAPAEVICRNAIIGMAQRAAWSRRRL